MDMSIHLSYLSLRRFHIKQTRKKIIPYTVVIGVAKPTSIKDAPGSLDMKMETGIRIQKADVIPCTMTGMLFPHPLKYPILENRIQVRIHSAENPLR